jgi:pyrroline-5-carboxylate reductase
MASLGIIGTGKLAAFMVQGLRHHGETGAIVLSPRNADRARLLAERFACAIAADNQAVVDAADAVLIATPPPQALATMRALHFRPGMLVVCCAIDVTLAELRAAAPEARVVRAMPTAASAFGLGSTPICPPDTEARLLFAKVGDVHACADEAIFRAATALTVYHLWAFALMEEVAQAGEAAGLPRDLAVNMVAGLTRTAGAYAAAADPAQTMRQPLDENGTEGTMTAQGLAVLDARDAFTPWREAVAAAIRRA